MFFENCKILTREKGNIAYLPYKKQLVELEDKIVSKITNKEDLSEFNKKLENLSDVKFEFCDEVKSLTLMLATKCNLKCTYCYADEGTYGESEELMDEITAINSVKKILSQHPSVELIRFFGGEPLLNFKVLKKVCEYVENYFSNKNIKFAVGTNGTILDGKIINLLKKYDIKVLISLDGPKELHDSNRIDKQGLGSHSKILKNLEMLKAEDIQFSLQCTYTKQHQKIKLHDLSSYLKQFTSTIAIAPCRLPTGVVEIKDEFDNFTRSLESLFTDQPVFLADVMHHISSILYKNNINHFCDANRRIVVFPNGDVYPCELLKFEKFYMGNVNRNDFDISGYKNIQEILSTFNRKDRLEDYWFKYLIPSICISNHINDAIQKDSKIKLTEKVVNLNDMYFTHVLIRLYKAKTNNEWDTLIENIKYYNKMIDLK
ncbi:radical SAM protein [Paramaledivibacter caminithermalis]|jgi:uncharacterized protein|uniref:Radical SAM additional 4Fe4S-binding SPASM domain-containing protein n=1 Tax=Paramaledivibacter caminithermalis (strain DSM 15212 / CIP 107654 / DViRD3) TaxID=1121301 RepID=A0A1M6RQE8_PARC5|nr:radical SAM protein [Paramaledivibacter caminithermalis]SHK34689.1 radical SAM additional 4Fe4S-binding SPASM domain-containing protein [Paramaledivibacter caminithermalis DSM 15212]